MELNNLVKNYKQTKDQKIINQIIGLLRDTIQNKAKYIFERKYYPLSLYHKCKVCREAQGEDKCTCIRGTFNLKKEHLCEYLDVENDLWCEILRIINNYDITKDFNTYLYATLWNWTPSFINKNFIKSLRNKSLSYANKEGKEMDIVDDDSENTIINNSTLQAIYSVCKTNREKEILSILLKNNKISQKQIAKKLKVTQQSVSKIIQKLRLNIKKVVEL